MKMKIVKIREIKVEKQRTRGNIENSYPSKNSRIDHRIKIFEKKF